MVLANLDLPQWILAITSLVAAMAALGGFALQQRKDHSEVTRTATSVAAEVTEASLSSLREALEVSDRRAAAADARADRAWTEFGVIRAEVRELRTAVAECELEKSGLIKRVRELEAAR